MRTLRQRLREQVSRLFRRGRTPGIRTAKTVLAAVVSFEIAEAIGTSESPILAPLTALLVVQLTLYETLTHSVTRVVSVIGGVLVATGVASFVGLTWWSLGLVVGGSLVLGRFLRLGPNLLEVPITAMLVLAVGGSESVAAGRIYETFIGAGVGILVNVAIAPPLYLQPAEDAIAELAERIAQFCRDLSTDLRRGWTRGAADRWLDTARALAGEVARADRTLGRAEESARFNPRGASAGQVQPRLRIALTGLEHCYSTLRNLTRALLDRTYFLPPHEESTAFAEEVRNALADVLEASGRAIEHVAHATAEPGSADAVRRDVSAELEQLSRHRDRLSALLMVDPKTDAGAWQQYGALLAAVDRLRVEVEAAVRPSDTVWRPPRVGELQQEAVRRFRRERAARATLRRRRRDDG